MTWGVKPRMRVRRSFSNPVVTESATSSVITLMVTPRIEISVIRLMNASRRLARR